MIVKKIPKLGASQVGEHAQHVRQLVEYMHKPDKGGHYAEALLAYLQNEHVKVDRLERLYHHGVRNLVSLTDGGRKVEMMATAAQALLSPNPLTHWLISWKEHERPTPAQVDDTATTFLEHLGLGSCQAIYAAHSDTHNVHLHIAVNRYDAIRERMVEVNNGLDWEASHQAVALIVDKQSWEPEGNARYRVSGGKLVMSERAKAALESGNKSPSANAAAYEARTGLKSAQRIAIEEAAPVMLSARNWGELHFKLATVGIECHRKSSGLVLRVGDEFVTASSVNRRCSFKHLEARIGPFKERVKTIVREDRAPARDIVDGAIGVVEFHAERRSSAAQRQRELEDALAKTDANCQAIRNSAKRDRSALEGLDDGGRSPERSMLKAVIKQKERDALEAEREALKQARKAIRDRYLRGIDFEEWLRAQNEQYLAERWRKRRLLAEWAATFEGAGDAQCGLQTIHNYVPRRWDGATLWARPGEATAFIEFADRLEIAQPKNDEAILAAFLIAANKFGRVTIKGPEEFQIRAAQVISTAGHGILIDNGDLRKRFAIPSGKGNLGLTNNLESEQMATGQIHRSDRDLGSDFPTNVQGWERD